MRFAFFGLPLAACLLRQDGRELGPVVLAPLPAPGRRRAQRLFGERLIDALELDAADLERQVDENLGEPDALLSWFWTRKLPPRWLTAARHGGYGVHPSLLPRHRGPDPFFWALDQGDTETGVTLHRLAEEYDTGDIVWQERLPLVSDLGVGTARAASSNAWRLAKALDRPSLKLLRRAAAQLDAGLELPSVAQSEELASFAPMPTGELLKCPWSAGTERVLRRVRALTPFPGVAIELNGVEFDLLEACDDPSLPRSLQPGEGYIDGGVWIRTADGGIRVVRLRLPSGEEVHGAQLAELVSARSEVLDSPPSLEGDP